MHRDNWGAVYANQDKILEAFKGLETDMFLAGGTGLHRFVLPRPYRHSEDLDFFFPTMRSRSEAERTADQIIRIITAIPGATLEDKRWFKEEQAFRMWCRFDDNNETIKIELLNFTSDRLRNTTYITDGIPFRIENLYNLLLYKLKALCDRPDTIKDLFDLYFITRSLSPVPMETVIEDLNKKFEPSIGIRYERGDIAKALRHRLQWDIEIGDIEHLHDLQGEISTFQSSLHEVIQHKSVLDFSYQSRIEKRAEKFDLDVTSYVEIVDVLEENSFWANEIKNIF